MMLVGAFHVGLDVFAYQFSLSLLRLWTIPLAQCYCFIS